MKISRVIISFILVCLTLVCLSSCKDKKIEYTQITPEEAKLLMDTEKEYTVIDARTSAEYEMGHIKNAVVLEPEDVQVLASQMFPNKDELILVYCQNDDRSKRVAETLANLGYTNVKDFGGLVKWPYETVK